MAINQYVFSQSPFMPYLGKDAVYNFIKSMIEDSKYCSDVIKNTLTKTCIDQRR